MLTNCFQSMADLAGAWTPPSPTAHHPIYGSPPPQDCTACVIGFLWTTRHPSETDPVIIDIGPGIFDPFICPKNTGTGGRFGHVTVRGAGRDETTLRPGATALTIDGRIGIHVNDCEDLNFSDLRAEGGKAGVVWWNGGAATWTRTDMVGKGLHGDFSAGWLDDADAGAQGSTQSLYDCRSSASASGTPRVDHEIGYWSYAAETYFFGGSISAGPSVKSARRRVIGVLLHKATDFKAFDTQITAKREQPGTVQDYSTVGVQAESAAPAPTALLQGASVLARGIGTTYDLRTVTGDELIIRVDTPIDAAAN